jgi:formylglycine-generating enzyme
MLSGSGRATRRRRTRTLVAATAAVAFGAIAVACGFDSLATSVYPDPPDVAEAGLDVSLPPKPDGSIPDADAEVDAEAGPSCPSTGGPMVMVDAGGLFFCIDATEVRNDEYDKFLLATNGGDVDAGGFDAGAPTGCATNASYARSGAGGDASVPVVNIDWCDANGYCRWAGKRLCGKNVAGDASSGEWFAACSNGGKLVYPYGQGYDAGACNDKNLGLRPVGSHPACQGGVTGLFDMAGNAAEIVDNCTAAGCSSMGADFSGPGSGCVSHAEYPKAFIAGSIGFRCCGDPR